MRKRSLRGIGLNDVEIDEVWKRYGRGETLKSIGRVLNKSSSSVYHVLSAYGGICPPPRRRSDLALTGGEREEISRGLAAHETIRTIAGEIGRSPSTISREIARNGGYSRYRAASADERAWSRSRRPKRCKLAKSPALRRKVALKLALEWSPEQISGWLKRTYPDQESLHVSHETIYRSLFVQSRGVLKKELLKHLRTRRSIRRSKQSSWKDGKRGQIKGLVSISERPASVEDRAIPGHWEGDLIAGSNASFIATLVERHSRFVMLVKVNNKETQTVVSALIRQVKTLPTQLWKTLTWDRGKELAGHRRFTIATEVDVYFCDPQSPWQRGSNENTNGLLRQYLPKKTDLSVYSQAQLNGIARRLNGRPRKTLNFETPSERLKASVASTI